MKRICCASICLLLLWVAEVAFCDLVGSIITEEPVGPLETRDKNMGNVAGLGEIDSSTPTDYPDFIFTYHHIPVIVFGDSYSPSDWSQWKDNLKHYTIKSDDSSWWFGIWVTGQGDVDGDGDNDALVTDTRFYNYKAWNKNTGIAYLLHNISEPPGTANILNVNYPGPQASVITVESEQVQSRFGCCSQIIEHSTAIDVTSINGDRYADIVFGESGWGPMTFQGSPDPMSYECGRACIFFGSELPSDTLTTSPSVTLITGEERNDHFGAAVSSVGDLDDDGCVDFAVGAPWYDMVSGARIVANNAGRVYIFNGDRDLDKMSYPLEALTDSSIIMTGNARDGFFGSALCSGDFDGDRKQDVVVGEHGYDRQRGRIYIFLADSLLGDNDGLVDASQADIIIEGNEPGDLFGNAVSSAGGFFDIHSQAEALIIGAPGAVNGIGAFYVFDMTVATGFMLASESDYTGEGSEIHPLMGCSVAQIGDVDGDGDCDVGIVAEGSVQIHDSTYSPKSPTIECSLNRSDFSPGDIFTASIEADNQAAFTVVDLYVGLIMPDGLIISIADGRLEAGLHPFVSWFFMPLGFHYGPAVILEVVVPANISSGDYIYAAAFTGPGELDFIGKVSSCPFTIDTQ